LANSSNDYIAGQLDALFQKDLQLKDRPSLFKQHLLIKLCVIVPEIIGDSLAAARYSVIFSRGNPPQQECATLSLEVLYNLPKERAFPTLSRPQTHFNPKRQLQS